MKSITQDECLLLASEVTDTLAEMFGIDATESEHCELALKIQEWLWTINVSVTALE